MRPPPRSRLLCLLHAAQTCDVTTISRCFAERLLSITHAAWSKVWKLSVAAHSAAAALSGALLGLSCSLERPSAHEVHEDAGAEEHLQREGQRQEQQRE